MKNRGSSAPRGWRKSEADKKGGSLDRRHKERGFLAACVDEGIEVIDVGDRAACAEFVGVDLEDNLSHREDEATVDLDPKKEAETFEEPLAEEFAVGIGIFNRERVEGQMKIGGDGGEGRGFREFGAGEEGPFDPLDLVAGDEGIDGKGEFFGDLAGLKGGIALGVDVEAAGIEDEALAADPREEFFKRLGFLLHPPCIKRIGTGDHFKLVHLADGDVFSRRGSRGQGHIHRHHEMGIGDPHKRR